MSMLFGLLAITYILQLIFVVACTTMEYFDTKKELFKYMVPWPYYVTKQLIKGYKKLKD